MNKDVWLATATAYVRQYKLSVIPLGKEKNPTEKWKEYQDRFATLPELIRWNRDNIGIATGALSNLVVVDLESREDALWFWNNKGQTPVVVRTKRGFHFWFKHPGQPVKNGQHVNDRYDVRGDGGFVVVPPSHHSKGRYEFVNGRGVENLHKIPTFQMEWRPETAPSGGEEFKRRVTDGRAYISQIHAHAGKGAHNDTWRAACRLKDAGLTESEALFALMEWANTNLWTKEGGHFPNPFTEILHKVRDCYGGSSG